MDISLAKKTLTAKNMQKTGIFAGYSFPYKNKDKLYGLYILYMLHSKTESTVILQLPGERNNKSDIVPQNMTNILSILVQPDGKRSLCITSQISAKDKSCQMHAVYVYNFTSSFRKLVCIFSCIFYTQISRT